MPLSRHLTFANVASATALVVALGGGGAAVAAGLAKNSVGSPQIKNGAVKTEDLDGNAVTGAKVKESSLGVVPRASTAHAVDTVVTKRVTAAVGQQKVLASRGSLTVVLTCYAGQGQDLAAAIELITSTDDTMMDANLSGDEFTELDADSDPASILSTTPSTERDIEDGGFSAITAAGASWKGYGFATARFRGADCLGEMTFLG